MQQPASCGQKPRSLRHSVFRRRQVCAVALPCVVLVVASRSFASAWVIPSSKSTSSTQTAYRMDLARGVSWREPARATSTGKTCVQCEPGRAPDASHAPWGLSGASGWRLSGLAATFAALLVYVVGSVGVLPTPAAAGDKRMVGEIPASGFLFKDTINIEEFNDPLVQGVNLYISDFSRSFTDRMSKGDFFSDPGAAGLTCVATGPVKVSPSLQSKKEGEDVFTESRSLLFKTLKVKRVYDKEGQNLIYVVFTERFNQDDDKNKSRFKSQLCALHVNGVMEK